VKEEVIEGIRVITPDKYVTDTMALVLWLENRKLPPKVKDIFEKTLSIPPWESIIYIPSIVLAEVGYLSEKGRIETNLLEIEKRLLPPNTGGFYVYGHQFEEIKTTFEITDIPELHDRLIAGVGRALQCKILTNDPKMINSKFVETLWE
jgi:predicted nucleic acid-binding protein